MERRRSGQLALSESEFRALLPRIPSFQESALLRLAIATGIRREDIVKIELGNVDTERGLIRFWERKKKRFWKAWIGGETLDILRIYIDTLPKRSRWLFPSPLGVKKPISSRTAYNVLQRNLKRAGLRLRPFHALRATCIKLLQKRGWTIEQVMEQTGDSFRTIKEHYETPSDDEMAESAKEKSI